MSMRERSISCPRCIFCSFPCCLHHRMGTLCNLLCINPKLCSAHLMRNAIVCLQLMTGQGVSQNRAVLQPSLMAKADITSLLEILTE